MMATRDRRFTVGQIVIMAWRQAGLINEHQFPDVDQASWARDILDTVVSEMSAKGIMARVIEPYSATLIDTVAVYDLPSYALAVVDTAMYVAKGQTSVELPVMQISRDTWQEITAKGAQGLPRLFYLERLGDVVRVRVWPVPTPSEDGGTIRFNVHAVNYNVSDANATMPCEEYWTTYFIYRLAYELAVAGSLPADRCAMLSANAELKYKDAIGYAKQSVYQQIILDHKIGV